MPYDFLTDFEQDVFEFDTSDSFMNFGTEQKVLFIGSFVLTQMLIDRILLRPEENGFNTQISVSSQESLTVLAALIHGIFSEVIYDTFQPIFIKRKILKPDLSNKKEVLHEFIYSRYNYKKDLPALERLEYAYTDQGADLNSKWWADMKVSCSKFIVLIFKML